MQYQGTITTDSSRTTATDRNGLESSDRRTYSKEYVRSLFDDAAQRYDLLNHLLSSGIDIHWRKKSIAILADKHPRAILDVATGTGDLAFEAARLNPGSIIGVDIATKMLNLAKKKATNRHLGKVVTFQEAAAEQLPFSTGSFDAVTVGFGARNFSNLEDGLAEIVRVLRPGGTAVILEFSRPRGALVGPLYRFYARRILPVIGGSLSNWKAYHYLPDTIEQFPDGERFATLLRTAGLREVEFHPQTFGIVTIYHGIKERRT